MKYGSTRRWLKIGLIGSGIVAGAVFGLVLTRLGKIIAGAPPAALKNYVWNAAVVIGAPLLLLVLPPVGIGLGVARLQHRYPDRQALPSDIHLQDRERHS